MNSLDALNAITRRALRINYESPPVCINIEDITSSGSGSSGSSTLDFLPVYRHDGPASLEATLVGGPAVALVWSEVSEAYLYLVYRANSEAGPWTAIATGVQNENYLDETVAPGTYFYKITGIEPDAGETYPSPTVSVVVT